MSNKPRPSELHLRQKELERKIRPWVEGVALLGPAGALLLFEGPAHAVLAFVLVGIVLALRHRLDPP